ncbi:MAG: YkgJ family cysteine cluster protein [Comamonadaceae bacterium]|nr:YkgJ family cysteine cluster protein [Comamonadaceae bacterium]
MSNASTSELPPFPCTRCGACCRSVALSPVTAWLDRGDGACRHLDDKSALCLIYEERPDICRIGHQYQMNYQKYFSWEEFCELNQECCTALQQNAMK